MCLQKTKYLDLNKDYDDGFHDNATKMLKAYMRERILSTSEREVEKGIHFIRMSNIIDSDSTWIYDMEGTLVKITGETWS